MNFADKYFSRVKTFNSFIETKPPENLQISVVVPVFNEPEVTKTLRSLLLNEFKHFKVEIIFVINSGEHNSDEIIVQNQKSKNELIAEFSKNKNSNINTFIIDVPNLPQKTAGAGLARKIGMDEALRRFNSINSPKSIIVSLDADTLVEKNYLQSIYDYYAENPKICGANINFEHPISGNEFSNDIYEAIIIYEIYLRYYIQALRFADYPHAFQTIGSAFSVRAETYSKHGGMVVNQSGEDFYFLHKIIPSCKFGEIKTTTVYPSPRITDRVIFGTGVAVQQIIENYNFDFKTYKLESFLILKEFFGQIENLFNKKSFEEIKTNHLLREYLKENNIKKRIKEIRANTNNKENFKKRFFAWFNALKVLKFLNYVHSNNFEKSSVISEAKKLLQKYQGQIPNNNIELLDFYRKIQNS